MSKKAPAAPGVLKAVDVLAQPTLPKGHAYCLIGPDEYLREEILSRLRAQLLDPGFAEFNHQVVRCSAASRLGQLTDALMELPVMTDLRLLELRNADSLPAKVVEGMLPILEQIRRQGGLVLALTFDKGKCDLLEAVRSQGVCVSLEMDDGERKRWVQHRVQELQLDIAREAQDALLERTGSEVRQLAAHLEKLKLYAGKEGKISLRDVELMVPLSAEVQTWRLTAAIGAKDLPGAYQVLDRLLERGEPVPSLLSYINSYLGSLAQLKSLQAELGSSPAQLAKALPRKTEFQIKKSLQEAATWSVAELAQAFDRLTRADLRMKSGDDERLMFQLLLLQLCSRKGG